MKTEIDRVASIVDTATVLARVARQTCDEEKVLRIVYAFADASVCGINSNVIVAIAAIVKAHGGIIAGQAGCSECTAINVLTTAINMLAQSVPAEQPCPKEVH